METTKIIKYEKDDYKQDFLIKKPSVTKGIYIGKIFISKLLPILKGVQSLSEISEIKTDDGLDMISNLLQKIDIDAISRAIDLIEEAEIEKVFDIVLANTFQKMPSDKGFETPIKENGYFPEPNHEFDFNLQIFLLKEFISFTFSDILKKNK